MSDLTPQDVDLRLTATRNELAEEDVRLWEGLEDEKISRIAGDEANKLFAEQVQSENQGTEGRLSTEVIHRSESDLNNINSLNALAQAMSDYRVKTALELAREKIAREQLGVDISYQIATIEASFNHREHMLYTAIEDVQNDVDGKYASMDKRIQKYEELLQDITTDSIQITMDNGEINMGAWTILSQAREWDLEIITSVKGYQDKTTEDINQALEDIKNKLPVEQDIIDKAIEALSAASIIKKLDDKLAANVEDIHNVQKDLLKEVQDRQDQMVGLAQEHANEMDKYNKELVAKIETESQARVDAIQREAEIRQAELVNEANERTAEIDEKLANIEIDLDVDLSALNKRVDDVNSKVDQLDTELSANIAATDKRVADVNTKVDGLNTDLIAKINTVDDRVTATNTAADLLGKKVDANKLDADTKHTALINKTDATSALVKAEEAARIAAIKTLDDGLTTEIQQRKDGDTANLTAINNYKVSNDAALANVRNKLAVNVTATTANATTIKALDVRLTTNETETVTAKSLAASATQKADTALTKTAALSTQMTTVNASIEDIKTDLGTKADSSAVSTLQADVAAIDGRVTTNSEAITALNTSVGTLDGTVKGHTSAISGLETKQTQQGNQITQLTTDTTALKSEVVDIKADMSTKVESTAFNQLKTEVIKHGDDINALNSSVTALGTKIDTVEGKVNTKADASAVTALETKVTKQGATLTSQGNSITKLTNDLAITDGKVNGKADAAALTALDTKVTKQGTDIASQGTAITKLTNDLATTNAKVDTKADSSALTALDSKVTTIDGKVTSQGSAITSLTGRVTKTEGDLLKKADSSAVTALETTVTKQGKDIATNSTALTKLAGRVTVNETNISKKADGSAVTALETKVTQQGEALTSHGNSITKLTNDLAVTDEKVVTKADASALTTLDNKVIQQGNTITSQGSAITKLTNDLKTTDDKVNTKADASALTALDTKVTQVDGKVTSQGTQLTELKSIVDGIELEIDGKADSAALAALDNKVTKQGTNISSNASAITALSGKVTIVEGELAKKADATAVSNLTTRVETAEGKITSQGTAITKLTSDLKTTDAKVATKAEASAVQALETKVSAIDGKVSVNSEAITKLTGRVETNEKNIANKLDASVIDAYSTTVETNKAIADRITSYDANLVIGGTNLLPNADWANKNTASVPNKWITGIGSGTNGKITFVGDTATYEYTNATRVSDISLKADIAGDTLVPITSSFELVSVEGNPEIRTTVQVYYTDGTYTSRSVTYSPRPYVAGKRYSVTTDPVITAGKTPSRINIWFSVLSPKVGSSGKVVIRLPQTEQGNKATAWGIGLKDLQEASSASAGAIQSIQAQVSDHEGRITSNSGSITNLTNRVTTAEGDIKKKADASAVNSLTSRVETAEGKITSQGSAITKLTSDLVVTNENVSKKADAAAVNSLTTRVEVAEGKITSQGTQISKLTNDLAITNGKVDAKADSSVVQALDSKVTQQGKDITSQGSAITKLTNDLALTNQEVSTKASVTALNALDTKVTKIDGTVTSQGTSITRIDAELTTTTATAENALKSVTVADTRKTNELPIWYWTNHPARIVNEFKEAAVIGVTGLGLHVNLETRVYYKDGSGGPIIQIAYAPLNPLLQQVRRSNGSGATATWLNWDQPLKNMDDAIKSKADASALSTLDAKVTKQGTDITAQGSAITKLTSDLEQTNAAVSKKADASALTTLDTKVTAIDGRVTSNTNVITTLSGRVTTVEEDVKKKADASVLTDYYTKVEADKAVAGSLEKYDANLVIGGSNLFRNTSFVVTPPATAPATWFSGIAGSVGSGASISYLNNKATIKVVNAASTSDVGIKQYMTDVTTAPVAISFDGELLSGTMPKLTCTLQYYYTDGTSSTHPRSAVNLVEGRYVSNVSYKPDVTKTVLRVLAWITTFPAAVGSNYEFVITKPQAERGHATAYAEPISDTKELITANATAIQNTNTEVSRINGVVVSHGSDITRLDNSLVTMQGQINSKADSSALTALDSKVTQQGKDITTQGTAITKVQASIDSVNNSTNNLLMKSNVVGLYDGVKYPHHFYEMSGPWEIGGTYTLLWCAEHKRGTGDTNSYIAAYAGGGSQNIQALTNTNGKVVSKVTFVKNSAAPLERVNFYMINKPTTDNGSIGTVYWAVLVKGSEVQGDSWFPGPYELKSEVTGLATAQSTLDAKVTTTDGKVTSNTSAITSLTGRVTATEGELAKKADASVLNSYYTKVEADKVTAGAVAQYKASLSIGGSNLYLKSKEFLGSPWVLGATAAVAETYLGLKVRATTSQWSGAHQFIAANLYPTGTEVTLSFYARSDDPNKTVGVYGFNVSGITIKDPAPNQTAQSLLTDKWKRYSATGKVTDGAVRFTMRPENPTTSGSILLCGLKMEIGNVGTDWSTSDEDVAVSLNANADAITSTNTEVSRIDGVVKTQGNQLTALTAKVDGKADASAITSLQATVTQQGKDIAANTDATTKLTNRVTTAEGQIVSNTSALSTLTTKVTDIDGRVTSQANDITKLNVETASKLSFILATNRNSAPIAGNLTRGMYNSQKARLVQFARGLNLVIWNADGTYKSNTPYDTYGQTTAASALATAINDMPANTYFSIVGSDTVGTSAATNSDLIAAITNNGGSAEYVAKWRVNALPIFTSKKGQAPNTGIQHMFDSPVAGDAIAYVLDIVGGVPVGLAGAPSIDTSQFASATALSSLEAKVTTIDGKTTSNANSLTQLQTTVDGHTSAIAVNASSINGIKAEYTIKLDVDGLVAGMGLINDGKTSAIGMNADYFYVGKPSNGKKPFMVLTTPQTIGGITYPAGTWIDVALIANATIGTAHIADASITNAKIKELDASKITTGVLNANRVRVGPTSTFDDGYNPATKARTFVAQPTVPYSVGDIWKNGSTTYICKTQRVAGSFTASEWDKVGDVTSENTAANSNQLGGTPAATINTNISNADTKAGNAQTTANTANTTAGQAKTAAATADSKAVAADTKAGNAASAAAAADSKATAADNKATSAQNTANSANNQVDAWKFTGTTKIDGGNIQADTITAAQISVDELSAISANLGTLVTYKDPTQPLKARMIQQGGLITVYDDNNILRVRLGLW